MSFFNPPFNGSHWGAASVTRSSYTQSQQHSSFAVVFATVALHSDPRSEMPDCRPVRPTSSRPLPMSHHTPPPFIAARPHISAQTQAHFKASLQMFLQMSLAAASCFLWLHTPASNFSRISLTRLLFYSSFFSVHRHEAIEVQVLAHIFSKTQKKAVSICSFFAFLKCSILFTKEGARCY